MVIARALAAAVVLAAGLLALAAVRSRPDLSPTGGSGLAQGAMLAAGWLVAAAGVTITPQRDRVAAALLVALGASWFVAELDSPAAGSATAFTLGLLTGAAMPAILIHLALATARPRGWAVVVTASYAVGLVTLGVVSAVTFDEVVAGCSECPANLVRVVGDATVHVDVERAGVRLAAIVYSTAALLLVLTLARATSSRRRSWGPVLVPATAGVALVAAAHVHGWSRGFLSNDEVDKTLWIAQSCALVALAAGVGWQHLAAGRSRRRLARIVVDVAASPTGTGLRRRLAETLGDDSLEIVYRAERGGWIDRNGDPASARPRDGGTVTTLVHDGTVVAAVMHRAGLLDDPRLLGELQRVARLAVDHEQLRAQLGGELARLHASRAHVVALTTAERRRLERDIHDGAQQGIVRLAMELGFAAASADDPRPFADARREVLAALDALRRLSHGIFPSMLDDQGIAAAIVALAEWDPRVSVGALPSNRFPTATEEVAYFCVATVMRASEHLLVSGAAHDGRLSLQLRASGLTPATATELRDRIATVGGRIDHRCEGDVAHVRVELPCA